MWGGNILSTVAGEFTYAIALDLGLLFLGVLGRVMRANRGRVCASALLAGVGLSHGYVLLWAGFVSLLELLFSRHRVRRFLNLVAIHGLAVSLMAFWLVPLLWYAPWATAYDPVSTFGSWQVAFPPALQPVAGLAAVFGALALTVGRARADLHSLGILWGGTAIAMGLYALAPAFGVVDVRFLPFAQLGLCLAAAAAIGTVLGRLPVPEVWPIVGVLALLPLAHAQVRIAPFQALYSYSGFETKAGWPLYQRLSQHLRGDAGDPRVAYEHSLEHITLGSERAFENLPLFSGRSTLDGLYMQSSATSPFVYYTQSEVSLESTCPLPDWGCARPDLDRGIGHLEMLNVSHFIARSPEIKAAARRQPRLVMETEIDGYEVFRLQRNDGRYVVPLAVAPFLVRTTHATAWKELAFRWFKQAGPEAALPVFASPSSGAEETAFAGAFDTVPGDPPSVALPAPPTIEEEIGVDRVRVTGCRPGHPLLIRISYHPRWRARTGERIWQAGPNLMLVFPRGETIDLEFASPLVVVLGRMVTALGLLIVVAGIVAARAPALTARATPGAVRGAIDLSATMVDRMERMTMPRAARWTMLVAGGALLAALLGMVRRVEPSQHRLYLQAQEHYKAGRLDEALPLFQRAQRGAPLSRFASLGRYFEAMIHFQRERWEPARQGFASVLAEFPEAITAPAAAYHLGVCQARLGDLESARRSWDRTLREFPGTPWANLAAERRAEHAAP
jgi:TolA-binding protein